MAIVLEVKSTQGDASLQRLQPGRNRITVRPGDAYRVIDEQTGHTPSGVSVKRVDNGIVIDGLGVAAGAEAPTVVELVDYYGICSAGNPCDIVIDEAGQTPVVISPISNSIGAMADGSYVLYDRSWVAPAEVAAADDGGAMSRPMMYGLGGAAILGLALSAGGGGGGGTAVGSSPGPNGVWQVTSAASTNSHTPVIAGTGQPGQKVSVQLDLNGDQVADLKYETTVAADGTWSVDLATATPQLGTLPPGGLPDSTTVLVANSTAELARYNLVFDDIPPAPARIDPITVDGVISAVERAAGVKITGSAEPGGTVLVNWGSVQKAGAVGADGRWSVDFASAEVPGNGQSQVSVISRDAAGNAAPATVAAVLVNLDGPNLSVTRIGSGTDTVINAAEAAAGVTISGIADPNATVQASWNGATAAAVADASGVWSVVFAPAQVPNPAAAEGQAFPVSIRATNSIGNTAALDVPVRVDRVGPAAPAIAVVEGDDRVTPSERAGGVRVNGTAEVGAQVEVSWGGTTLTTEANASGQWAVSFSPAQVPTAANGAVASVPVTARATDTAGNVGAAASRPVTIDPPYNPPTINLVEGDDRVSAAERADGVVLSGTVQAGAPGVTVTWGGFSQTVVPSGTTWQVTVPAAQVPADGTTEVRATIAVSGGPSASRPVVVDTTPPAAPTIAAVEGDNRVTVAEAADGVVISGRSEANATIEIAWGTTSRTATADASGNWSANFTTVPQVATGGAATQVSAVAVDQAGNRGAAATASVFVEAPFPPPTINAVTGDWVVNSAEAAAGVLITGTHAAGVTAMQLTIGTVTVPVTLGAGNTWQASVSAAQWQAIGEGTVNLTATNGGTGGGGAASHTVGVDLTPPAITFDPISGDNRVLFTETNVVVSGHAPGAVQVIVQNGNGVPVSAAVAANGDWSVTFPSLGGVPGSGAVNVRAVDAAGNQATASQPYSIILIDLTAGDSLPGGLAGQPLTLDALATDHGSTPAATPTTTTLVEPVAIISPLLDEMTHHQQAIGLI